MAWNSSTPASYCSILTCDRKCSKLNLERKNKSSAICFYHIFLAKNKPFAGIDVYSLNVCYHHTQKCVFHLHIMIPTALMKLCPHRRKCLFMSGPVKTAINVALRSVPPTAFSTWRSWMTCWIPRQPWLEACATVMSNNRWFTWTSNMTRNKRCLWTLRTVCLCFCRRGCNAIRLATFPTVVSRFCAWWCWCLCGWRSIFMSFC